MRTGLLAALLVCIAWAPGARAASRPLEPVFLGASLVAPDDTLAPCRSPDCVLRHVRAASTVRLTGEFGRYVGRVDRWDTDRLSGFTVDPDWGGTVPDVPVDWQHISRVEKRVANTRGGATIGAIALGSIAGLFALITSSLSNATLFGPTDEDRHRIARDSWAGVAIGGAFGGLLGAGIGAQSHHWELVYQRPVATR